MLRLALLVLVVVFAPARAAADGVAAKKERDILLPEFPRPPLVVEDGAPRRINSMRLLRELQRGGVRGWDRFDAVDGDYALFRGDSLGGLAAWLETACKALEYDLAGARGGRYDGAVFSRLLNVATSIASLREGTTFLAMPIGVIACRREAAWGELPADGREDAYVIFATDRGMLVYDPPTRQLVALADFPNRGQVIKVWF